MRTVLFVNTKARKGKLHAKRVQKYLAKHLTEDEITDVITIDKNQGFENCLERLAALRNPQKVIIGGGDGTIVAVFNALRGQNIVYGIVPLGTSNVFVRSLGISVDITKALKTVCSGKIKPITLGEINGTLFANSAGTGVPVEVVQKIDHKTKRWLGPLSYIFIGVKEFILHDAFLCNIELQNGEKHVFYTHHLLIANGSHHGLVPVGQNSSVHNNLLTVFAFGTTKNRFDYAKSILKFGLGKQKIAKTTKVLSAQSFSLLTNPIKPIEADGEPIGHTPAKISAVKKAVKIIC